jgi:hypothetical protein
MPRKRKAPARDQKVSRELKRAITAIKKIPVDVMLVALHRTKLIYPLLSRFPEASAPVSRTGKLIGKWSVAGKCDFYDIWDENTTGKYRICNSKSGFPVDIWVDGKLKIMSLFQGKCKDVQGKKIQVHMADDHGTASGEYDNLD